MTLKVIGAGVGRTGTHSLKIALEQLLGGPCHHMVEVFGRSRPKRRAGSTLSKAAPLTGQRCLPATSLLSTGPGVPSGPTVSRQSRGAGTAFRTRPGILVPQRIQHNLSIV